MRENLVKHWFLVALAICFATGFLGANRLRVLMELDALRNAIVFGVMWAIGVTLRGETVRSGLLRPAPSVVAILVNAIAVPVLSLPWMLVLPPNLFGGLFVTSIVPCTLASASVWTRRAHGDDSIAMLTTVVTNLACVAVVPIGMWLVLSQATQLDVGQQVSKLTMLVVVPLLLAQVMRRVGLDRWADRNRYELALSGQIGILAMVVFGAVASATSVAGAGGDDAMTGLGITGVLLSTNVVHVSALYLGIVLGKMLAMSRPSQIAIGIAGSQKTLMIGLQIAIDCGVSVVPMIVYHLSQLVVDTIVADRWRAGSTRQSTAEKDGSSCDAGGGEARDAQVKTEPGDREGLQRP
jgi:sodium/bile acid cotransporter 7